MTQATLKDVLYALEFGNAQLCRRSSAPGRQQAWSLEPGGVKVLHGVADKAREHTSVALLSNSRFGEDRYGWVAT